MRTIIKLLVRLAGRLAFERSIAWGRRLGWAIGSVLRYRRAEALGVIRRCLPGKDAAECRAILDGMYANLGQNIMETARFATLTREWKEQHVEVHGMEIVQQALAAGRGAIMLTAHLGSFQLPAMIAGFYGIPITIIIKKVKPEALDEFWHAVRQRLGVKSVEHHNSFRACLAALKANELLGFIFDQNMKRNEGIFVDFFGQPACTSPGVALLSAIVGSPVIPAFTYRKPDGNHRVDMQPALPPPPDREPETVRRATQAYTALVEEAIRRHPEQWIWIHRRWRTRPLAEQE